jgi:choline dehydrogenase-like flavoprotein
MSERELFHEAEVCVIGAGPAGSIAAAELVGQGARVVVIESGPRHDPSRRPEYVRRYLRGDNPWRTPVAGLDRYTSVGSMAFPLDQKQVRGVGGGSLAWEGHAMRFHPDDFRLRTLHGIAEDWPIEYETLEPYYGRAEQALGVSGPIDDPWAAPRSTAFPMPPFPLSHSDRIFAEAAAKIGVRLHHLAQARNSEPYAGRPACQACGTCAVCPTGAKASVDLTHVPAALESKRATLLSDTSALKLVTDRPDRVSQVVYMGADGLERRLAARVVVLAAGAVENARLLLLSGSSSHPAGLANQSGLVGAGFMCQPAVDVIGRVSRKVHPYRIGFSTAMSRQFCARDDRSRQGAFLIEFLNSAGPTPAAIAADSGKWGEALRAHVREEFGQMLGIRIYCEHLPDPGNTVTLDPSVRDPFGQPVPRIAYQLGPYERRALDAGKQVAARILRAAGAPQVSTTDLTVSGHLAGTHRMGRDPGASVVDADLRAHGVDNLYLLGGGAFVTASASPPTLTIAALAIRAAEHIARRLRL